MIDIIFFLSEISSIILLVIVLVLLGYFYKNLRKPNNEQSYDSLEDVINSFKLSIIEELENKFNEKINTIFDNEEIQNKLASIVVQSFGAFLNYEDNVKNLGQNLFSAFEDQLKELINNVNPLNGINSNQISIDDPELKQDGEALIRGAITNIFEEMPDAPIILNKLYPNWEEQLKANPKKLLDRIRWLQETGAIDVYLSVRNKLKEFAFNLNPAKSVNNLLNSSSKPNNNYQSTM